MAQTPWGRAAALRAGVQRHHALLVQLGPVPAPAAGLPAVVRDPLSYTPALPGAPGVAPLQAVPRRPSPEREDSGDPGSASSAAAPPVPCPEGAGAAFGAKRRKDDTAVAGPAEKRASRAAATALIRDSVQWAQAKGDFKEAMLKPSSRLSADSHLETAELLVAESMQTSLLPLTTEKLMNVGAALRAAHYLSAPSYLRAAKAEHIASDMGWSGSLERVFNRCVKACQRGRGPITRAGLGDMEAFAAAAWSHVNLAPKGPVASSTFCVTCVSFLLREIEGALITVGQATISETLDGKALRLFLPVSKVDHWGAGAARSLVCLCPDRNSGASRRAGKGMPCVVCRVEAQLAVRRGQTDDKDAPLFPDVEGRFPSKEGCVATLAALFVPLEGKITGHSPRRMGAQMLAALSVDEPAICWFGRWGSAAIKAYLADARARSRSGRRIWLDALAAEATPGRPAGPAMPGASEATARHVEAIRAAAPPQQRIAVGKTYVLNTETRRLHVFAAGMAISLCGFFTLDKHSALPNPVLQGKAYRGRDVDPCNRCRRLAEKRGLLSGGRPAGAELEGSSSSEASEDSEMGES